MDGQRKVRQPRPGGTENSQMINLSRVRERLQKEVANMSEEQYAAVIGGAPVVEAAAMPFEGRPASPLSKPVTPKFSNRRRTMKEKQQEQQLLAMAEREEVLNSHSSDGGSVSVLAAVGGIVVTGASLYAAYWLYTRFGSEGARKALSVVQ